MMIAEATLTMPARLFGLWDDRHGWRRLSDGGMDLRTSPDGLSAHLAYRAKSDKSYQRAEAVHGGVIELVPHMRGDEMMTQLRTILAERRKAAYWRNKFWDRMRTKHGLPTEMGLSIDQGTGEVHELGDATHLVCTVDADDLAEIQAIPNDADFDRYERHILGI